MSAIVEVTKWEDILHSVVSQTVNLDIHRLFASLLFERLPENISDEQRNIAKLLLFDLKYNNLQGVKAALAVIPIPGEYIEQHRNN